MSSISSITKMVSGLQAAQKGLQVTGQNISNVNTQGYTRQQLLQVESGYLNVGNVGGRLLQVGLGVTPQEVRQIRDDLADKRLREENAVLNYYQTLTGMINDIEATLDEPYGESITELLNDFWAQTQKLNTTPNGVEERMSFIRSANVLITQINAISTSLEGYQDNLNSEVIRSVNRINEIIQEVQSCNELISKAEISGDNANDYRDQRNLLLDELSRYGEINYYEEADNKIVLKFEGHTVVDKTFTASMKLEQAAEQSTFVKPVWSDSNGDVYKFNSTITSAKGNDTGQLKALLQARGNNYVSGNTTWNDVALNDNFSVETDGNSFLIPEIQMKLNEFAKQLVSIVNDSLDGTGIGFHEGKDGVDVFVHINKPVEDDYKDPTTGVVDDVAYEAAVKATFIPGNIQVNPELLADGGYNKLGTVSKDGSADDTGDNSTITKLLAAWTSGIEWYKDATSASAPVSKKVDLNTFYSEFVTDIGTNGSNYIAKTTEKNISITNIENERQAMGGVSLDEEFSYMLKYQYAYNAASRMITMLDSMMETVIGIV